MNRGSVYIWTIDDRLPVGGRISKEVVDLGILAEDQQGQPCLRSNLVKAYNGGRIYELDPRSGKYHDVPIGDVQPDFNGDFIFEPGKGGGRLEKYPFAAEEFISRYVQAAHFGEVNTFYHLQKIAAYVDDLQRELGEPSLPRIIAIVNAHHAVTEMHGLRDGFLRAEDHWVCFQGGHYRLPSKRHSVPEYHPLSVNGEIHLGPGRQLLDAGALVEHAGCRYRANASHNAGIIYHEYGHHITRHTADFRANELRSLDNQDNKKPAIDEAICDYWAATMLDTPHIWAWHKRHDAEQRHPRSLASPKTMDDFDASSNGDPHLNGTIWAAALWDLRTRLRQRERDGARKTDRLVLKALALIRAEGFQASSIKATRQMRASYAFGFEQLLKADRVLHGGHFRDEIVESFRQRKIEVSESRDALKMTRPLEDVQLPKGLRRLAAADIPHSRDILSALDLERRLNAQGGRLYSLIAAGDIMLGDRMLRPIREFGQDYPFVGVLPLLNSAAIVLGNLEGPFSRSAQRQERKFSYRVHPKLASSLKRANINIVTLANNHLLDCGRDGIVETFDALAKAGVHVVGAGRNEAAAHEPIVLDAGPLRVGILGYYWNKRCAATAELPGSATDEPSWLSADIQKLRQRVDRVVVTFHWGIPYERMPQADDRAKARLAIDVGADLVVAHHPHIIQPFEIYRGRPIFYSIGNFAFGSGNSRAEGMLVAASFEQLETVIDVYPISVKNRDPRVNYQPKVLSAAIGQKILSSLASMSGTSGALLNIEGGIGRLRLKLSDLAEAFQ